MLIHAMLQVISLFPSHLCCIMVETSWADLLRGFIAACLPRQSCWAMQ